MSKGRFFPITKVISYCIDNNEILFNCQGKILGSGTVKLSFFKNGFIRYWFKPGPFLKNDFDKNLLIQESQIEKEIIKKTEVKNGLIVNFLDYEILINFDPWNFAIKKNGQMITQEVSEDIFLGGDFITYPLGYFDDNQVTSQCTYALEYHVQECIYGFGEKFNSLEKSGQTIRIWNQDARTVCTEKAYKNIPFFMSTRGYGFLLTNSQPSIFHIASKSTRSIGIEIENNSFEYWMILGSDLKDILKKYTLLTGKPRSIPKWSLGLWVSTSVSDVSDKEIIKKAKTLRSKNIPFDVMYIDIYWMRPDMFCDFTCYDKNFPNPTNFINTLKEMGYKICLWEHPYVSVHSEMFQDGTQNNYFVKNSHGEPYLVDEWGGWHQSMAIVDFTNPEAVNWYKEKHRILINMGIDTFKTDFGEGIPEDAVFFNGKTGKEMRNLYARLYNQTVYEVIEELKEKAIIWHRSAFIGSQMFPVGWSGDPSCKWPDMASVLRGGLSSSLSGFSLWSHDIGGFWGTPTAELYTRWAQLGLLSPCSRYHGDTLRDPWLFGLEAEEIFRKIVQLRYSLLPYIWFYFNESKKTGLPVVRPLVLEYEDDYASRYIDTEYLLGENLLIAPVLSPDGYQEIYLPKGEWYDFWTGKKINGGVLIKQKTPINIIPIFVRSKTILPLATTKLYTESEWKYDKICIYLSSVYENYQQEINIDQATFKLEKRENGAITMFSTGVNDYYAWLIFGIAKPTKIKDDNGNLVNESKNRGESNKWFWDENNNVLEVSQGFKKISIFS